MNAPFWLADLGRASRLYLADLFRVDEIGRLTLRLSDCSSGLDPSGRLATELAILKAAVRLPMPSDCVAPEDGRCRPLPQPSEASNISLR